MLEDYDKERFYEVEADEYRFTCACGESYTATIYPITCPTDGPVLMDCKNCDKIYWFSRKQSKLYDNDTQKEAPECMRFIAKVPALQLKTLKT